jgi:RHS repeat-associated protein
VQTGTDPTDSTSYKMMASPRPAAINNSISNVVTYNLSNFYEDYYKDDVMTLKIPANGLQPGKVNALANVNNNPVDFNGAAVSGFTLPADYSLASRFVSFEPTAFSPTANIEIDLPVNDENSAAADNYSVYYHSTAGWAMAEASLTYVATPIFIRPVLPILTIKVLAPDIVVVVKKHSVTTAYFDEGLIATNGFAAIGMDLAILDVPYNASATLTIDYKDFGQSANPPTSSYSTGLLNVQDPESGKYDLVFSADPLLESAGKIQISHISLFSSIAGVSYSQNYLYEILPGQKAKLVAHKNAFLMNKDLSSLAWEWIDNNSSVTLDIAGEGRIRRSGAGFSYDYFLKDHLGSTREVINEEDGTVSEATMYYPYGTMVPLQAPAPGDDSKEKFTGKEFDANGVVNGVGGIDAYYFEARMYDPEIGTFTSIDPAEQFYNSYRYTTNPIGFVDPSGTYDFGIYQGPYPLVQPITYQTNYGSSFFPSLAKDIGGFLYSGIGGTVNFVSSSLGSISNTFGLTYVNAGLNSGAAFVIGNTIGKVPEPVWTVIDDAGTAAMSLEGLGVIPKEIAIAGRAARELEEGGVIAGEAGRFAELDARAIVGDALTPHHMPQAALNFTSRAEGGALVLPKSEHVLTRTYGISGAKTAITEAGMPFRNVLARDILDVKKLTGSTYNSGLQDLLLYYRTDFPQLLRK